jgi:alpha-1,2-mannosyltransferase
LLLEGRYRTIIAGGCTLVGLVIMSTLLFGLDVWSAMLDGLREGQAYNQISGKIRASTFAHLYGPLKAAGFSHTAALHWNIAVALLSGCAALRIWLSAPDPTVKHAVVVIMTLLLAPHLHYYEFVVTGAAIVWLWPYPELRPALALLWAAPVLQLFIPDPGVPMLTITTLMLLVQLNRNWRLNLPPARA